MVAVVQGNEQQESTLLHSKLQWKGGWGFNGPGGGGRGWAMVATPHDLCVLQTLHFTNSPLFLVFPGTREEGGRSCRRYPCCFNPIPCSPSCHSPTITGLLLQERRERLLQSFAAAWRPCSAAGPVLQLLATKHISSIQHVKQASLHGLPLPPPQKKHPPLPPSTNSQTHFFSQLQPSSPTPFTLQYSTISTEAAVT